MPAQVQIETAHLDALRQRQGTAQVFAQNLAEALHAPVVDQVLDAGPLAIGTIAVVAE